MNRKHQDDDEGVAVWENEKSWCCFVDVYYLAVERNNNFQRMQTTGGDSLAQTKIKGMSVFFFLLLYISLLKEKLLSAGCNQNGGGGEKYAPSLV